MTLIDLRSDTVTRPTSAMRDAMANAEVGDDVYGEDPSVQALEAYVAELAGTEGALFVTSGTMGNQLALALHTQPGDEVIVGEGAHVVVYESGAGAALSGVQFALAGKGGLFDDAAMERCIHPNTDWSPRTRLVCIENTHNRAGGRIFPQPGVIAIAARARALGLAVHLDGARIWNVAAATGLSIRDLLAPFDTASLCFSKGLGAPVGSALCGSLEHLKRARRLRKMWGGGMRQSGLLAAAAHYALRHHRERLSEDHESAKAFAMGVQGVDGLHVDVAHVETNVIAIDIDPPMTAAALVREARSLGVLVSETGPQRIRAVTHLDVSRCDVERAAELLASAAKNAKMSSFSPTFARS